MPLRAFWMSMGLTMTPGYPRPPRPMRGYGRGVRAATIAGLLADPTRLKVVAALALGAGTIEDVSRVADLPLKDVALAARRLARNGLVRRVVLEHLVRVFEPGVRYPEREVNALLAVWHPDVAALRRYLVDEGLLTREAGVYWRTGGYVEV